jgi:hypothetical protein
MHRYDQSTRYLRSTRPPERPDKTNTCPTLERIICREPYYYVPGYGRYASKCCGGGGLCGLYWDTLGSVGETTAVANDGSGLSGGLTDGLGIMGETASSLSVLGDIGACEGGPALEWSAGIAAAAAKPGGYPVTCCGDTCPIGAGGDP